jgi:hypothetical protein
MNIIRTLGFAAVAALSLGVGAAMAQEGGGSDAAGAVTQHNSSPWASPVARSATTAVQSGSSDFDAQAPKPIGQLLPGNNYDIGSGGGSGS